MKQQNINPFSSISLKLTADAIEWLSGTTTDNDGNEIRNIDIFTGLLKEMRTAAGYDGTYRRPLNLKPGQAQFSEIGLAERWKLGRKKMHNILSRMEAVGLVEIYNSRIGSVITFSCVTGWETPDKPIDDSEINDR
ncbi:MULTISPECIES: hypothetical protein [Bacteroidales]|jgi:Transcriptional regulators|uniref:Uncharacterized protein n=1 Tax=Duncaniella muris TaxID=2094150 RepID=A0A2V1IM94_9BACT|nr:MULTISPECIES: hypothetical protein [Bacteroidales]PWB00271.1 hypothetical protein C5O23_13380 [Duncaniella muris]ROT12409.1 hypothetical protein EEL48_12615 [Muribaculaceae bacterium Isolate-102 (HZI)]